MPWPFSESIKKRACRYLLQRYLGHFLQEKLSLEQLTLDLYQGTGSLTQVPLDKWVRDAGAAPPRLLLRLKDQLIPCLRLPPTLFSISNLLYVKKLTGIINISSSELISDKLTLGKRKNNHETKQVFTVF